MFTAIRPPKIGGKLLLLGLCGIALAIAFALLLAGGQREEQPEIITKTALEKIVRVSELSTFEVTYNGVAQVMNEKKPENVDYYVSYAAQVKVGFDFSKIRFDLDNDEKQLVVHIPEVAITKISVDLPSLDYIFMNDKANTETASAQAYKACEADVALESENQPAIFELAQQNAENMVRALVVPFLKQMDPEYTVSFQRGHNDEANDGDDPVAGFSGDAVRLRPESTCS